jgi:hypothetical protein
MRTSFRSNKLGHQAPRGYVDNRFNSIEIAGDFAYCKSHNFLYNAEVEEEKLYNALPCYYTDNRFKDTMHNYYKNCMLHWTRWKNISLKACIRKTLSCYNIPVGTVVQFNKSWYIPNKKVDLSYAFKIKKENKFPIEFEINDPNFFKNFNTCEFSKNLTDALRANGFIVSVINKNPDFISGMIASAVVYKGGEAEVSDDGGEIATAYGYGKKIGFSSGNNSYRGYSDGCDCILYDYFGEFDKWSRCIGIPKTTPINEIVEMLKEPKKEE